MSSNLDRRVAIYFSKLVYFVILSKENIEFAQIPSTCMKELNYFPRIPMYCDAYSVVIIRYFVLIIIKNCKSGIVWKTEIDGV